jgi:hypothetical protein
MIEFLLVLFFFVGFGIRCRRWLRGTDPRRARLLEVQRERERRSGRFPAEGVPVHEGSKRLESGEADPVLPWREP